MGWRWSLIGLTVATLGVLAAQPKATLSFRITEKTTLGQVLSELARQTTAQLRMDETTRSFVHRYTFPPHMLGVTVKGNNVGEVLAFLFGAGWEGSPLKQELRSQFPNRMLARTPMPVTIGNKKLWSCNNRAFDWKWEKPKGGPAGGIITVRLRVQTDGDIVKRQPIDLRPLQNEFSLDYLRDRIKDLTGVYFNIDPEWHQNVHYKLLPEYRGQVLPADPHIPLFVRKMRAIFGDSIDKPKTLGEWLSAFAEGLNEHSKARGCLWKWTCSDGAKPVYTLRCYTHTENE
ncbi:MAG: hypothetical protein RMK89_02230 [Armatimonadota bacterium]|nr:hypothetical protein [Armatimonadota bacterium]MDW8142259.1 hypothetical protein [Armatimonadota bacterium]